MALEKLIFAEDIFDNLFKGKVCTIRQGRRDVELGDLLCESLEEHRLKTVNVIMVIYCSLQDIPDEFVENDGYLEHYDMLAKMRRFYPDIELTTECSVIIFEV